MTSGPSLIDLAKECERQRWALSLQGDATALADLFSDELQFIHSSGLRDSKATYLNAIRRQAVVYRSASSNIDAVTSLGDTAFIATGTVQMSASIDGAVRDMQSLFTVVWRREQGMWRLVAHQTTRLPA